MFDVQFTLGILTGENQIIVDSNFVVNLNILIDLIYSFQYIICASYLRWIYNLWPLEYEVKGIFLEFL